MTYFIIHAPKGSSEMDYAALDKLTSDGLVKETVHISDTQNFDDVNADLNHFVDEVTAGQEGNTDSIYSALHGLVTAVPPRQITAMQLSEEGAARIETIKEKLIPQLEPETKNEELDDHATPKLDPAFKTVTVSSGP